MPSGWSVIFRRVSASQGMLHFSAFMYSLRTVSGTYRSALREQVTQDLAAKKIPDLILRNICGATAGGVTLFAFHWSLGWAIASWKALSIAAASAATGAIFGPLLYRFALWVSYRLKAPKKVWEASQVALTQATNRIKALDGQLLEFSDDAESEETNATVRPRLWGPYVVLRVKNWSLHPSTFRVAVRKQPGGYELKCPWLDKEVEEISLLREEEHDAIIAELRPEPQSDRGQWHAPTRKAPSQFMGPLFRLSDQSEPDPESAQGQALDLVVKLLAHPVLRNDYRKTIRLVSRDYAYVQVRGGQWQLIDRDD